MNHKAIRAALLACALVLPAAGCVPAASTSTTTTTPASSLSLAQVQAQVVSINNAIQASNAIFQASPAATAAQKAMANTAALAAAASANLVKQATQATSASALLNTFVSDVQTALPLLAPVLGVNPATAALISLGMALVQAFAGQVVLPVALPLRAGAMLGVVEAPVAVPLPKG